MSPVPRTPPAHLDDEGQRLWHAYIETGARLRDAKREHRVAKRAYQARLSPGTPPDPARHARYLAAQEDLERWRDARALASRQYHAFTRRHIARIAATPNSQRTRRVADDPT